MKTGTIVQSRRGLRSSALAGALFWAFVPAPAQAWQMTSQPADSAAAANQPDPQATTDEASKHQESSQQPKRSGTDIFSRNTFALVLDGRAVVANGARSWIDRGFGKTRFDGTDDGDYEAALVPVEATAAWMPRFTNSLSANISGGWQRGLENDIDLIEAFINFLPAQKGPVGFSVRAGLMWPEISLEHATGGVWSTVNTITPSAINSWVGEEVKVIGVEGTVRTSLGEHQVAATGAVFGYNDTSGTLLSFRGWALHDIKATAFGHLPLPPLNDFMKNAQEDQTRSLIELDHRPGFYGRLEWRPPAPFGVSVFYYDNRGRPEVFNEDLQWGWRTRFWNVGLNADLGPKTRLLAQGMSGSTIMGFAPGGVNWVHTRFDSAYVLVTHDVAPNLSVTGRVEAFRTRESGSRMSPDESEDGWSWTAALRRRITDNLSVFAEALNVRSKRGSRERIGLDPFQAQTVFQLALRFSL